MVNKSIAKHRFRNRELALSHAAARDTPRLVGARPHLVRLRVFLRRQSCLKNVFHSLRGLCPGLPLLTKAIRNTLFSI